ncbi:MAG: putative toxin-antitoxin system toxin component, PIN family [Pseudomonadota bacterium]|nr:putative toxin-antitoxin system toxin component, PIN family [Pseudomonadota bacterium]MDP1905904.1 putative toxin-antitoxin system toxin component, PIN family [Pseudomonadota bacterium]MDP2351776.1 putative toxin-antitoxin system toxin component, PIN family [Pseudomonadota bacterium]
MKLEGPSPALALEKALLHFDVAVSDETLDELATVLRRPKFDGYVSSEARQAFIEGFSARTRHFVVTQVVSDCPDPKDNKFLALAETAGAEFIIASDPHLTDMHPWRGIPILPPAAFLVGIR